MWRGEGRGGELAGGRDGDAEFLEFGAGLAVFFGTGIAPDYLAEFADGIVLLAKLNERHAFPESSGGQLEAFWIVGQDFFVGGDGIGKLLLLEGDLAEIELGVGSEVGVTVILEVVLEFGAGEIIFAAGDVAETVGIERVSGRRAGGHCGGASRGTRGARGSRCRGGAGDLGVYALDGILEIDELLVELAEARLDFLEVVRESLDLRRHGVEARAGIRLNILDGFLERAHGAFELAEARIGLVDDGAHAGVILRNLSGQILLTLKLGGDVALKLDELPGDGFRGARTDQASRECAGQNGGAKHGDITHTHKQSS